MSSTEPTSDEDVYLVDTTSTARTPGVRDLVMTDRWNTPIERPNGGYVLAAMLRGTGDELGVPHDPLYAAISYLGPPSVGPATIEVEPVKQGRRVVTASTRLLQDGRLVAVMTSGFGPPGGRAHHRARIPSGPAGARPVPGPLRPRGANRRAVRPGGPPVRHRARLVDGRPQR